jgi:hypothetical protein
MASPLASSERSPPAPQGLGRRRRLRGWAAAGEDQPVEQCGDAAAWLTSTNRIASVNRRSERLGRNEEAASACQEAAASPGRRFLNARLPASGSPFRMGARTLG